MEHEHDGEDEDDDDGGRGSFVLMSSEQVGDGGRGMVCVWGICGSCSSGKQTCVVVHPEIQTTKRKQTTHTASPFPFLIIINDACLMPPLP